MAGDLTLGIKLVSDSSGVVRGLRLTEAELERLAQRMRRASDDTSRINSRFNLLQGTLNRLGGVLAGVFAAGKLVDFVKSVTEAQIQLQKIEFTLQAVTGSAAAAHKEFEFVAGVSDRLGLSLTDTAAGYARLASSALGAGESLKRLHQGFTGLSEAFSVLHLSGEEVNRILIQLEQGFSLGRIQMIDLRALAQSLPGTFELASKAIAGTGKSLEQMLKEGGIPAKLFFEQLTHELHEKYGPTAVETSNSLQAALNRLNNTIFNLKAEASGGGFLADTTQALKDLNDTLKQPSFKEGLDILLTGLAGIAKYTAQIVSYIGMTSEKGLGDAIGNWLGLTDNINNPVYKALLAKRDDIESQIKARKGYIGNLYPGEHPELVKKWKAEIASLQNQRDTLIANMMRVQPTIQLGTVTVSAPKLPPPIDQKAQKALQDRINKDSWDFEWGQITKKPAVGTPAGDLSTVALPKLKDIGQLQSQFEKLTQTSNKFADSIKQTLDPMQALQDAAGQMTSQFINGLTDAVLSGKSFGKVLEDITKQIGEMIIKLTIEFAIREAMQSLLFAANGAAFGGGGNVLPFANGGVVVRPTPFKFAAGGTMRNGIMGEAGPEAIMPLKRLAGGKLGVHAEGSGGAVVNINDYRSTSAPPVEVNQRRGQDGRQVIDVTIRDSVERLANSGQLDPVLAQNFGVKRRGRF